MNLTRRLLYCLVILGLVATSIQAAPTETASYRVRFQSTWSASTHPQNFPPNPHFSGLIGGVHNDQVKFWEDGGFASPGIEEMAERGQKTPLDQEVEQAIMEGTALAVIDGGGIGNSPGSTQAFFTASLDYSLVTLVSMIAPSPDWFVGVESQDMFQNGDWVRELVVPLYAWDAGTDNGTTYVAQDSDTNPPDPIHVLVGGGAGNGQPMGSFRFTRLDPPDPEPLTLQNGRFELRVEWKNGQGTLGVGHPVELTDESGWFWFFQPSNLEMVVKVVDACAFNDRFWVFASGLTNVEVELTVLDTEADVTRTWMNPQNTPFAPILDTEAFATCP